MLNVKIIDKKNIKYVVLILIVAFIAYSFLKEENKSDLYDTIVVERGELLQEVSVTGRVTPAESVNLAFEKTGKISQIYTSIGDMVLKGKLLIKLENSDLFAQVNQAEANVKIQQAKLDELSRGYRDEEIEIQKVKVLNAEVSLNEAKINIVDTLGDAFTKSDNAIRNNVDQFFNNTSTYSPTLNLSISDGILKNKIEQERAQIEGVLDSWTSLLPLIIISSDLNSHIVTIKNNLNDIRIMLDNVAIAVNSVSSSSSLPQTIIDGYKADVSSARISINTAISNISTSEEKYNGAISSLSLEERELILKEVGTAPEQIVAQQAKVEEALSSVDNSRAQLRKTLIYAPFSGIVTKQGVKVGEVVSSGTTVVSVISESEFEIEANVPEADIAKLSVGDTASVTLDAYRDDVFFNATVTEIEPAETIIENVATYKTTLQFNEKDERIRSGMTANIDILTEKRSNVIAVPNRAVLINNMGKIVRILSGDSYIEVPVKTGIRGSFGNIEIIEGLVEGDEVIIIIKDR